MRVTEQVYRNAGGEIEVARAVFVDQVAVLAANGPHTAPRVHGHERGD
jgi:hypothetical protein